MQLTPGGNALFVIAVGECPALGAIRLSPADQEHCHLSGKRVPTTARFIYP